jgi:hypothetical protein
MDDACGQIDAVADDAPPRVGAGERLAAAAVCAAAMALLGVAAWLEPAAAGIGTHRQMGLSACAWHRDRGYVCPTCGMTTAFALMADGRMVDAVRVQPAGAAMAMMTAMAAWAAGYIAATGAPVMRWLRRTVRLRWVVGGLMLMVIAAWGWKATQ